MTRRRIWPGRLRALATAYLTTVAVAVVVVVVLAPPAGPLALVRIFGEHLVLGGLVLVPMAVGDGAGARSVRVALIAVLALGAIRFGGDWVSLPSAGPTAERPGLVAMTFNLEVSSRLAAESVAFLRGMPADVMGLQELTPDVADAIDADAALVVRYPHRALFPEPGAFGSGILSRHPLRDVVSEQRPDRVAATVDTPTGPIRFLTGHPPPPGIGRGPFGLPTGFDPTERDELNREVRRWIEEALAGSDPVVVVGDFNTAAGEAQFGPLTAGLRDAHAEAGLGPGWTYRPRALAWLGTGLVRIDLVLAGPGVAPVASTVACPRVGDHCAVVATLVRDPPG
jgi:endonuclease/exonuclease/phosphatase (EEP) superfamily protein YafD